MYSRGYRTATKMRPRMLYTPIKKTRSPADSRMAWDRAGMATRDLLVIIMFHLPLLSEETRLRHAARHEVDDEDQHEVDRRIEQADGGREAEVVIDQADLIHIRVDDLGRAEVERVLQEVDLLEADGHDVARREDRQDDDGRTQRGQVDGEHAPPARRPVDGGRLVQRRVDARQRGQ